MAKEKNPISEKNKFYQALNQIIDPDIGVGIADMGLIYKAEEKGGKVHLDMTLTSMGCPAGPELINDAKNAVQKLSKGKEVELNVVWDPPWNPDMMKNNLKEMLFGNY